MEYSGLGFIDAIKELSSRVGLLVPEDEGRRTHDGPKISGWTGAARGVEVLLRAAQAFREGDYLVSRGAVFSEIAQKFGIGYAPEGGQSLAAAFDDYGAAELQLAGLVGKSDDGRLYDRLSRSG